MKGVLCPVTKEHYDWLQEKWGQVWRLSKQQQSVELATSGQERTLSSCSRAEQPLFSFSSRELWCTMSTSVSTWCNSLLLLLACR